MISLLKFIRGYVRLSCSGPMLERFMNQCASRHILLWQIVVKDGVLTCFVSNQALPLVKETARKSMTHIEIEKRYGLYHLFYRHRGRKVFVLGAILALVSLYVMSLFLWDINIEGNETVATTDIMDYVTQNFVHGGQLVSQVDTVLLEEELRTHYDEFAWVSCEIAGTQLTIHIKETIPLNEVHTATQPADLIANKDGVIASIVTRAGTAKVVAGKTVQKGDVLISGTIEYQNDSQEVYEEAYVPADGDIIAKTTVSYEDSFSLSYYQKKPLDECRYGVWVTCFSNELALFDAKLSSKEYDTKEKTYAVKLGKTFYMPLSMRVVTYQAYQLERVTQNESEGKQKAKQRFSSYCKKLCKKGVEIVGNNVTIKVDGETVTACGDITVLEPIGKVSLIDVNEKEQEKLKENENERSGEAD